jgi:hypothetical protein
MSTSQKTSPSLLADTRGAELIEKLVVIALFIFIAAVGLKYLGDRTSGKLESQGQAIEGANDTLPQ